MPIGTSAVVVFGGLLAGSLTVGEEADGYTSAAHSITEVNEDHATARRAAIVADGFYIAAAGGVVVQLGVMLPLCLTTKVCETDAVREGVSVSRRGELVVRW